MNPYMALSHCKNIINQWNLQRISQNNIGNEEGLSKFSIICHFYYYLNLFFYNGYFTKDTGNLHHENAFFRQNL